MSLEEYVAKPVFKSKELKLSNKFSKASKKKKEFGKLEQFNLKKELSQNLKHDLMEMLPAVPQKDSQKDSKNDESSQEGTTTQYKEKLSNITKTLLAKVSSNSSLFLIDGLNKDSQNISWPLHQPKNSFDSTTTLASSNTSPNNGSTWIQENTSSLFDSTNNAFIGTQVSLPNYFKGFASSSMENAAPSYEKKHTHQDLNNIMQIVSSSQLIDLPMPEIIDVPTPAQFIASGQPPIGTKQTFLEKFMP